MMRTLTAVGLLLTPGIAWAQQSTTPAKNSATPQSLTGRNRSTAARPGCMARDHVEVVSAGGAVGITQAEQTAHSLGVHRSASR
jgi:hypothetical protein